MRRFVIIPVDDDRVTDARISMIDARDDEGVGRTIASDVVPVPLDDQLTRDIDEVTRTTLGSLDQEGDLGHDGHALYDMALRLRAAFKLDEEGDDGYHHD